MKRNTNIQDLTKEAINKTQNSGYENEYFYIVANIPTLQNIGNITNP